MRIYECLIEYEMTGCFGDTNEGTILVKAKSVKEALEKANCYRKAGGSKKSC